MSVYKEEASASVDMDQIYIPLRVVPEGAVEADAQGTRADPASLLTPGACHVILGDPGSGKSTLLRFLALAGSQPQLIKRYGTQKDDRLPILVTLHRYADELKSRPRLSLLDYILELTRSDLGLAAVSAELFEYYLYAGQAILLLDGLDELPSPDFKATVRDRVAELLQRYPANTVVVTSRIVGYDKEVRYDSLGFSHHRMARLNLEDIADFVTNWYNARLENTAERQRHSNDLIRIVNDSESRAIRELAENPLLLTIICLVHRIDAVLPDERVVLYQKCTETLLNTWHAWKFQSEQMRSRNKVERRNRARIEAIAYWMHCLLDKEGKAQRAVVPYGDLRDFLTQYITEIEEPPQDDPRELAEVFLRFVKERAGLLIEAGDGLYSFVHLTFQEYLGSWPVLVIVGREIYMQLMLATLRGKSSAPACSTSATWRGHDSPPSTAWRVPFQGHPSPALYRAAYMPTRLLHGPGLAHAGQQPVPGHRVTPPRSGGSRARGVLDQTCGASASSTG